MQLPPSELPQLFGSIDIYLFDQLLKGRFQPGMRILDVGCGSGRNLPYFLQQAFDVSASDPSSRAIEAVRQLAAHLAPALPASNFRVEPAEAPSFPADSFDAVIVSAVFHFAQDEGHFRSMVAGTWRVLRPGGLFFARLASSIGIEDRVRPLGAGRYHLPDGSDRFLVSEALLVEVGSALDATELEPLKTVNVAHQRCMTTWCLRKGA